MPLDALTHMIDGESIVKKYEKRADFTKAWTIMRGVTKHMQIPWLRERSSLSHALKPRRDACIENEMPKMRVLRIILRRIEMPLPEPIVPPVPRRSKRIATQKYQK